MPELAEVVFFASQWEKGLGKTVTEVTFHPRARVFRAFQDPVRLHRLEGKRLTDSRTHGKQLFFKIGAHWLRGHLGMSGSLTCRSPADAVGKHDHLILHQSHQDLVYTDPRMFGRWEMLDNDTLDQLWNSLPPQVTDPRFTISWLRDHLKRRSARPLKAVILMQEIFPGIGNWMADEILWQSGLHPARPCATLSASETQTLHRKTRLVSRQAIKRIGRDWGDLPRSWLFSQRWKPSGHCPRGHELHRDTIAGRTTCWCPRCQPAPS